MTLGRQTDGPGVVVGGRIADVTERKPPKVNFEPWIDRQVRTSIDRGEFDNLPGAGKPIPGLDRPHDDLWWVKDKLRREQLSVLPPTLALRKEGENALAAALQAPSEEQVRRIITDINAKIRAAIILPVAGPPLTMVPFDMDRVVGRWRAGRPAYEAPDDAGPVKPPPKRAPWWRRRVLAGRDDRRGTDGRSAAAGGTNAAR